MHKKSAKSQRLLSSSRKNYEDRSKQLVVTPTYHIFNNSFNNYNNNNNNRAGYFTITNDNGFGGSDYSCHTSNGDKSRSSSSCLGNQMEQCLWLEHAENSVACRSLEHWAIIERTLYEKDYQLLSGPLFEECSQWKNQLPHLRVSGVEIIENLIEKNSNNFETSLSSLQKKREKSAAKTISQKGDELINFEQHHFSKESSVPSLGHQNLKQEKENVIDYILEFICKELAEIELEKQAEAEEQDSNDFLKIVPALTTITSSIASNNHYNENNVLGLTTKGKHRNEKSEKNENYLETRKNKQGMIFNERVIVNPVPFVISTRESFSTLTQTPIYYGSNFDTADNFQLGTKLKGSKNKSFLTRKASLKSAGQHVQTTLNTPVSSTVWSKNVKLTPMDASRLLNSKKRATKTAENIFPRCNHYSLSPISNSIHTQTPRIPAHEDNHLEQLEIRGSHMETRMKDSKTERTRLSRIKRVGGR